MYSSGVAYIEGKVVRILYQQPDYVVATLSVHRSEGVGTPGTATFTGPLYGLKKLDAGVTVGLRGTWGNHPKYGPQMKVEGWEPYARNPAEAGRFLTACIEGFEDPFLTERVTQGFEDPFRALTERPEDVVALAEPSTPDAVGVRRAVVGWQQARAQMDLATYLQTMHLPAEVIRSVHAIFGSDALRLIRENPYRLVQVPGFGFERADNLALSQGVSADDPRRVEGAILHALHDQASQGHLCLPRASLPLILQRMGEGEAIEPFGPDLGVAVTEALERMIATGSAKFDPMTGVYLGVHWRHERGSARFLAAFIREGKTREEFDVPAFLAEYQSHNRIELSDDQREAVGKLMDNRVLVLTGLPGTGKTTLVRALVSLFRLLGREVALMAPTGIAAKRLAAVTGHDASTIHRALRYDGSGWGYGAHNKLTAPAVIVDEVSMVDQELLYRLLDALQPGTFLVLVGDDAQLPSVGPGNVLRELMNCEAVPHVRLTQIFRQAETSEIILASHQVHRGGVLDLNQPRDSDFQFVPVPEEEKVTRLIVQMAERLKGRDANFQVLSPKYDGVTGVDNLNESLREALNPDRGQGQCKVGKLHMRIGDRVMIVKNDYELAVYNGDMGKLVDVTPQTVRVRVHGIGSGAVDLYVDIPRDEAGDLLRLAYAITVHKSQGSEFETVIFPVVRAHGRMLQRNLLYTALTRAKKRVWLIGEAGAVQRSILNDKVVRRYTGLGWAVSRAMAGVDDLA